MPTPCRPGARVGFIVLSVLTLWLAANPPSQAAAPTPHPATNESVAVQLMTLGLTPENLALATTDATTFENIRNAVGDDRAWTEYLRRRESLHDARAHAERLKSTAKSAAASSLSSQLLAADAAVQAAARSLDDARRDVMELVAEQFDDAEALDLARAIENTDLPPRFRLHQLDQTQRDRLVEALRVAEELGAAALDHDGDALLHAAERHPLTTTAQARLAASEQTHTLAIATALAESEPR